MCLLSSYQLFLSELLPSHPILPPRAEHGAHMLLALLSVFILEVPLSLHGQSLHGILRFLRLPTCPRPGSLIPILCVLLLFAVLCFPSLISQTHSSWWTCFNICPLWREKICKYQKGLSHLSQIFPCVFPSQLSVPCMLNFHKSFVWEAQKLAQGKAAYADLPACPHPVVSELLLIEIEEPFASPSGC